jgi:hypothetical protein
MATAIERAEGSALRPGGSLPPGRTGIHYTGSWVGPRAGMDTCGKSRPTGIRSPDRPTRSQSLRPNHTNMHADYIASMCFVWLSEETVSFTLYIINRLVFITEAESVYCAVGIDSLYRVIKKSLYTCPYCNHQVHRDLLINLYKRDMFRP